MATLNQEQVNKILENKPQGSTRESVLSALRARGHKFQLPEQTQPVEQPKGFLQKTEDVVTKVFPGQKVGEAIGTLGGLGLTALKEKLGLVPKGTTKQFDTSAPTPAQVAGDVGAGALTVAGFKGAGLGKTALGTVGRGAGLGAGFGASEALVEGGEAKDVAKGAVGGALVGGAVSGALVGAEHVARSIKQLPSRFIRSAFGQSKKELLAGKDVTKFVTENKRIGTADNLLRKSKSEISKIGSDIQKRLEGVTKKVSPNSLYKAIGASPEVKNAQLSTADIKGIIEKLAPQSKRLLNKKTLSLQEANKLRQLLDSTIGDRGFLVSQQPLNKTILKQFANITREKVKTLAPDGTRNLFTRLASEITLRDTIANKVAQGSRNQIISFGDLIGGGIGGVAGGVPGAIAGAATRRVVQSTPFLTGSAVTADALSKSLLPILRKLEPSVQTEIISAIEKGLISENNTK